MSDMENNKVLSQMRAMAAQLEPKAPVADDSQDKFATVMADAVNRVSDQQATANQLVTDFQTGASDASVAEVMVAM